MSQSLHFLQRQIGSLSETDLRHMRLFRKVVDARGLTAAVDRFGLEKTALSRAIGSLEKRLDGTLCSRGPRGFALTDYGRKVYTAALEIEDAVDRARTQINIAYRTIEGEVRLGMADNCLSNADAKISNAIEKFLPIAPAVRLTAAIYPPDRLVPALRAREIHLAIAPNDLVGAGLAAEPLFAEQSSLYCCPHPGEKPPSLQQLSERGYGLVQRRFTTESLAKLSDQIDAAWTAEASGLEAVATLVATGRCAGFLPDHYVSGTRTRRPFVVVPKSQHLRLATVFSAVTERDRTVSQAVTAMREALVEEALRTGTAQRARALLQPFRSD